MAPELWEAARDNKISIVTQLLEEGVDVNTSRHDGWTPLLAAIDSRRTEVFHLLLQQRNIDIEAAYPEDGYRPLHKAAQVGWVEALDALLKKGADIEAGDKYKKTPLYVAALQGKGAAVQFLISKGAQKEAPNTDQNTPIHAAAKMGSVNVVRILVDAGVDINLLGGASKTPLYTAALWGQEKVVQYLLDQGADPTRQTTNKWSVLHITAHKNNTELLKLFLRDGRLNIEETKVPDDRTPLHEAVERDSFEAVRILLDAGANIDCIDKYRRNPVHAAAALDNQQILRELVKRKAKVNFLNGKGHSPLHEAILLGKKRAIRLLLQTREDSNLDVSLRTSDDETPLALAQAKGDKEVIKLLADLDAGYHEESTGSYHRGGTMAGTGVASSESWFRKLSDLSDVLRLPGGVLSEKKVKIAIIDTGIQPDHPNIGQIKDYRDFATEKHDERQDAIGHGSAGVELICKVLSDQDPDIYVARAFETEEGSEKEQNNVAEAIKYACEIWKVDIIALACGFRHPIPKLKEQIEQASSSRNPTLIFSAASNSGNQEFIAYPAREFTQAIGIFATDASVKALNSMNPAANRRCYNFAILGENIHVKTGIPSGKSKMNYRNGTSFATFIAAAVAGMILDFSRHEDVKDTINHPENLRSVVSMQDVFNEMATYDGTYHCMAPWKILPNGRNQNEREHIARKLAISSDKAFF